MKFPLSGRAVFITGASGGLGEGLAIACAKRGARLALASRNLKATAAVAARCKQAGAPEARAYRLDLSKPAQARSVAAKAAKDLGGIDVLVNNAGVHLFADVQSLPEPIFKQAFETNLYGPLRLIQALLPGMKARKSGLIVNIGSTLAFRSIPHAAGYCATKGALARLTESLRMELAGTGVRVLDASPGVVTTRLRANAYYRGVKPAPPESLPFPRGVERTADEIVDAMEAGRRDVMSAAWPVRLVMKYLQALAPGLLDRFFR